jgi:hypothetical protein
MPRRVFVQRYPKGYAAMRESERMYALTDRLGYVPVNRKAYTNWLKTAKGGQP